MTDEEAGTTIKAGESHEDSREYMIKEKTRPSSQAFDRDAVERSTGTSFNIATSTSFNPQR